MASAHVDAAPATYEAGASPDGVLLIRLAGDWQIAGGLPALDGLEQALSGALSGAPVRFDAGQLGAWDSALVSFVLKCRHHCEERGLQFDPAGLPEGARRLLELAVAVPEKAGARREREEGSVLLLPLRLATRVATEARDALTFLGECALALVRLARGRARMRWSEVTVNVQECGIEALPIVLLIGFLVGAIIGFVGATQLAMFGASIYVADLVVIAMLRELGCIMTGVIMSGRTGASFAARLGTMQTNEEIDAFETLGIPPVEFLVLPRLIALVLMMPLLTLFSDLAGVAGGMLVGLMQPDLNFTLYWRETLKAATMTDLFIGLGKSLVFGAIIALTGCLRGLQCGRNAAAVGLATTSAVVVSITWIIAADGVFAVIFNLLKL